MIKDLILVVDDSDISRAVIKRYLIEAGFRVVEAADGAQGAVQALREVPSVVITDLEMPIMDGFQLARLLKADANTAHVPVVILTSHTEAASRFWGLQTGADAYVTKDDIDSNLIAVVRGLVRERSGEVPEIQNAPQGPLDVLARVARHLDAGLMEATLINQTLQIGMDRGDLAKACKDVLSLFSCLTHASLLGICLLDCNQLKIHLHRPSSRQFVISMAEMKNFAARRFSVSLVDLDAVEFEGDVRGVGDNLGLGTAVTIDLALRDAQGFLVVWPEQGDQFNGLPRELMVKACPHASLVIDNVLMAERLWELSTFDGLTGLLNHRAIRERLNEELDRAHRHKTTLAIILCDIDNFKRVNDSYGHLIGDAVLRDVSVSLAKGQRASDVVGRYGGEEFLAILPHSDLASARVVADRICESLITRRIQLPDVDEPLIVTASFGVASSAEVSGPGSADAFVALADRRLYEAKESGRACVKP